MATLEEIVIQLTAETSQLRAELAGATKAVSQSSDKMEKSLKEFSQESKKQLTFAQQAMATFTGFLGSQAVLGAFNALKNGARSAFGVLVDGMESAKKEEAAMLRLANSLQLSGKYSAESVKDLRAFAGEMERITGVGDDVVASNLAVLSSMTKLSSDGLKEAQKAALDLSSAYGIDLDTATTAVGKAINGNVSGLQRLGLQVDQSSDKTQQFANVMKGLAGVQGSAQANMKTFGGAVLGVKNSFGNFVEEIGRAVTGNTVLIAAFQKVAEIFSSLTSAAEGNGRALREGIAVAFLFVAEAAAIALQATDVFLRTLRAGMQAVLLPVMALIDGFKALGAVIKGDFEAAKNAFDGTKGAFQDMVGEFQNQTVLGDIADKIREVKDAGATAFDGLAQSSDQAVPSVKAVTATVVELTEAQKNYQEVIKAFGEGLAKQTQALGSELEFRRAMLDQAVQQEVISMEEAFAQKFAMQQEQFAIENQALIDARAQGLISEAQYQDALTALQNKQALEARGLVIERNKFEEQMNQQRVQNLRSTFSTIATLSSSSNKELASIGKAAAITQATIDGYAAVQKALASAPPPFNFALAGLVGAATAANVAKIAGVGLRRGIDSVPGVGNQDNFPAVLAPGERVVPSETNRDLTAFLQQQQSQPRQVSVNINVNVAPGSGLTQEQTANIVEAMNSYFANGGLKLMGAM